MKVSKQQKVMGGILVLGALALSADRLFFFHGAGESPAGPAADYAVVRGGAPVVDNAAAHSVSVSERLRNAGRATADSQWRDAFALRAAWPAPDQTPREPDLSAQQFSNSHRLSGVLTADGRSHAMVDGKIVTIGQVIDGFTLVSISHRSVTFESGNMRAVLNMAERSGVGAVAGAAQ